MIVFCFFDFALILGRDDSEEKTLSVREESISHLAFHLLRFLFIVKNSASLGPVSSVSSFGPFQLCEHASQRTVTLSLTVIDML